MDRAVTAHQPGVRITGLPATRYSLSVDNLTTLCFMSETNVSLDFTQIVVAIQSMGASRDVYANECSNILCK